MTSELKMKKLFCMLALQMCVGSMAQAAVEQGSEKKFAGTTVLSLDKLMPGREGGLPAQIAYDAKLSTVLNKTVREEGPILTTRLLSTLPDRKKNLQFLIDFEQGPSNDPMFVVVAGNGKKVIGTINAEQLIVPGDGFFYAVSRMNRNYVEYRKFSLRGDKLAEVKQPFLYAGLDSTALRPLTIFSGKDGGEVVAAIAKGERLTVVLGEKNYLLIKTRENLLGWLKLDPIVATREKMAIEGVYFDGD